MHWKDIIKLAQWGGKRGSESEIVKVQGRDGLNPFALRIRSDRGVYLQYKTFNLLGRKCVFLPHKGKPFLVLPGLLLILTLAQLLPASTFDAQRANSYVYVLASDSLQGRRSGQPGGEKAAAWIADKFAEFGLKPGVGDTSYFQNFTIASPVEAVPMAFQILPDGGQSDTATFQYGEDFVSFAYGGTGLVQGEVVFIGYGISEPKKGRNDLQGAKLKGKIVLALRGAPTDEGEDYWEEEHTNGYKSSHARDAGAIGYLQVLGDRAVQGTIQQKYFRRDLPAFWISGEACDKLLSGTGLTLDSLFARANSNKEGYHLELPCDVKLEAHAGVISDTPTRNVLAYVPGADPEGESLPPGLAHEIVLLGAHMDHLGVDAIGRVYNGAEDNASGTALLMELARTLVASPIPPRRSVYFCAFAGEELGLVGSEEFVQNPPVPLDSVVAVINMDMVGEGGEGLSIGGAPNFPSTWQVWDRTLSDPGGRLAPSAKSRIRHFKPGHNSDHAPFEEVGIPAFSVFGRGEHLHYHHPDDDADLIQPEVLAEVGDTVYRGMRALADDPVPLANPRRFEEYLWQSAETVQIGAPALPLDSGDDWPDLILYEAGHSIDPSARNRLRKLLVELSRFDSLLTALGSDRVRSVSSFADIPSGLRIPALIPGIVSPALVEGEPEIYKVLEKLDVHFIRVPIDRNGSYFEARGLKQAGRDLLEQLKNAPQMVIWEVGSFRDAGQLLENADRPIVIQVSGLEGETEAVRLRRGLESSLVRNSHAFMLLSREIAGRLERKRFEALEDAVGHRNLGVMVEGEQEALDLIRTWLDWGYDQARIQGLLGGNFIRWMKKGAVR